MRTGSRSGRPVVFEAGAGTTNTDTGARGAQCETRPPVVSRHKYDGVTPARGTTIAGDGRLRAGDRVLAGMTHKFTPPQRYSVAGAAARISSSRRAGSLSQRCRESQAKPGCSGSPAAATPSSQRTAQGTGLRRHRCMPDPAGASTAAIADFPAPALPVMNTALIGAHHRQS